jgi:hypothetical protein
MRTREHRHEHNDREWNTYDWDKGARQHCQTPKNSTSAVIHTIKLGARTPIV